MKIAIVCGRKIPRTEKSAFIRIIYYINDYIQPFTIIDRRELAKKFYNIDFDLYIIPYSFDRSNFNCIKFFKKNKKYNIIWLINEYDLTFDGSYSQLFKNNSFHVIANHPKETRTLKIGDGLKNWYNLNLNCTAYRSEKKIEKKYDFIYYGRLRQNRLKYFKEYCFSENVIHSCNQIEALKFKKLGSKARYIKTLNLHNKNSSELSLFYTTLYIEDEKTHTRYNHLSDRYYEALGNNVIIFFDINCVNNIKISGHIVDDFFIVKSNNELLSKIDKVKKDFEYYLSLQERNIIKIKEEQESLKLKLLHIFNSIIQGKDE